MRCLPPASPQCADIDSLGCVPVPISRHISQMAASALLPVRLVNKNGEGRRSPMDAPAPAPPSAAPGRGATDAALLAADGGLDAPWARGLGDLQPTGASRRCASRSVARVPCAACRVPRVVGPSGDLSCVRVWSLSLVSCWQTTHRSRTGRWGRHSTTCPSSGSVPSPPIHHVCHTRVQGNLTLSTARLTPSVMCVSVAPAAWTGRGRGETSSTSTQPTGSSPLPPLLLCHRRTTARCSHTPPMRVFVCV